MAGIFRSTETCYGTNQIVQNFNPAPLLQVADPAQPSGIEPLSDQRLGQLRNQVAELIKARAQRQKEGKVFVQAFRLTALQGQIALYEADGTPKRLAMGVRERERVLNSPIYQRGEIDKPGELVPRGVVQVVTTSIPEIRQGSGRLELADWLASPENPLTARVMVNRIWLHLFGRGLVPTPDNFGAAGQPPSHPELLDHLAVTFMENGWSVKTLIRQLVLSRAYQLDSRFDARASEADPDNVLVWRMSKRRLEAEAVRDAMLAVSGQLDLAKPKGSAVARAGEGNSFGLHAAGAFDARLPVRSVYLPVLRNNFLDVAGTLRLPRPGSDRRGACHDDGTGAGVVPVEQSVRDAPGRDGRHPAPLGFRRRLRLPADRSLPARPQSSADGGGADRDREVPRLLRTRTGHPQRAPGGSHRSSSRVGGHLPGIVRERNSSIEVDHGPSCQPDLPCFGGWFR